MSHSEKSLPFIIGVVMSAVAALITLGVIKPTAKGDFQTVEAAKDFKNEIKEEFKINRETHERIFQELKEQRGEIMSAQIQILRELKRGR